MPAAPITITSLPEDILTRIFTLVPTSPGVLGEFSFTISHVYKRWRTLMISSPLFWTTIQITSRSNVDALREVLRRSKECDLDIYLLPSVVDGHSRGRKRYSSLRDATLILLDDVARWRSLNITLPSNILNSILPLITQVPLPRLCSLQLSQSDTNSTVSHCGPLILNSTFFSTVELRGVTIHCLHPANLAGVTSVKFSETASSIINQEVLDTLGGVISPIHPPCMLHLTSLFIFAENPSVPLHPTFRVTTLVSLKLGGLCSSSPALIAPFIGLFNTLSSPFLRHLELDTLLGWAWDAFLQSLQSTEVPKYPGLQTLTMRSLRLRAIDPTFAAAFPAITHLNLFEVDPSPIMSLVSGTMIWPGLTVMVDGSRAQL